MPIKITNLPVTDIAKQEVTCSNCKACCCRLEVMLFGDTGVPDKFIHTDKWGSETMRRLSDGWCAALNRDTYQCSIYANRPLVCREFALGSDECLSERSEWL